MTIANPCMEEAVNPGGLQEVNYSVHVLNYMWTDKSNQGFSNNATS